MLQWLGGNAHNILRTVFGLKQRRLIVVADAVDEESAGRVCRHARLTRRRIDKEEGEGIRVKTRVLDSGDIEDKR